MVSYLTGWWPSSSDAPISRVIQEVGLLRALLDYVQSIPTWIYCSFGLSSVAWWFRERLWCFSSSKDSFFTPAVRRARKAFRKVKKATNLSPTVIVLICILIVCLVLLAVWYKCYRQKNVSTPAPRISLQEIVVHGNAQDDVVDQVVVSQKSKAQRLSRFRKVFKDNPRHKRRSPKD